MKYSMRGNVDPFIVMDVMENARKAEEGGRKIIHMEVGQPSTAAPSGALERTSQIIKSTPLGYTVALGLPELRKKIHVAEDNGVGISNWKRAESTFSFPS